MFFDLLLTATTTTTKTTITHLFYIPYHSTFWSHRYCHQSPLLQGHSSIDTPLATMPARTPTLVKLDFPEKLIQTGKGAGGDALLKRLKVGLCLRSACHQLHKGTWRDIGGIESSRGPWLTIRRACIRSWPFWNRTWRTQGHLIQSGNHWSIK